MHVFSNKVIPIDQMIAGKPVSIPEIWNAARLYPLHFIGEVFCLVMMIIGVYVTGEYAFEIGRFFGRSLS
jgi:hypothetical protein